jgi:hypothetical protein
MYSCEKHIFTNNRVQGLKVRQKKNHFSFIEITNMYNNYFFLKKCLGLWISYTLRNQKKKSIIYKHITRINFLKN